MRLRATLCLLLLMTACERRNQTFQDLTNSADPVYRIDLAKCARTPEWDNLTLTNGQVADVTIVQLGETKLYIPMAWLRERGWHREARPPSLGVTASTGGAGSTNPTLDPHFRAGRLERQPNCPGVVHVVEHQPPRDRRIDPDFRLTLYFADSTTGPPANDYSRSLPTVYQHNSVDLAFSHDRRFDNSDLAKAITLPFPAGPTARVNGTPYTYGIDAAGWTVTGTNRGGSLSLIDRSSDAHDALNDRFAGQNVLGVISFPFWATENIAVTYHVQEKHVPPEEWSKFRAPLRDLVRWLMTPPKHRDNNRRFRL